MSIDSYLRDKAELINTALQKYLPPSNEYPKAIHEAMHYSLFAGGKRLRPILTLESAKAVGGSEQEVMPFACALEMIHTYSLIHDDLPCMDNDEYRRGKLTNHKVFGEAIALLAGDALLTQAFEVMSKELPVYSAKPSLRLMAIHEVAKAIGTRGMIGGQVVDMISVSQSSDEKIINYIHTHKTGELLRASVRIGGILAGGTERQLDYLSNYAENIGLVFQIVDDILDSIGDEGKIGKKVGSDLANEKLTYVSVYGIKKAKILAKKATENAIEALKEFGGEAEILREIAYYILMRDR